MLKVKDQKIPFFVDVELMNSVFCVVKKGIKNVRIVFFKLPPQRSDQNLRARNWPSSVIMGRSGFDFETGLALN